MLFGGFPIQCFKTCTKACDRSSHSKIKSKASETLVRSDSTIYIHEQLLLCDDVYRNGDQTQSIIHLHNTLDRIGYFPIRGLLTICDNPINLPHLDELMFPTIDCCVDFIDGDERVKYVKKKKMAGIDSTTLERLLASLVLRRAGATVLDAEKDVLHSRYNLTALTAKGASVAQILTTSIRFVNTILHK